MQPDSYSCEYCREHNKNRNGLDILNDQWLEELGDMIVASVGEGDKMHPDSHFCEYCREQNKNGTGLDVLNDQWLEELGDMIVAAVEGVGREQSFPDVCFGRCASA